MTQSERQQQRTDRNLDWLSEWQSIADCLRERTGHDWSAELREGSWTPFIELDGNVSLFAKPHPDTSGSKKAFVAVRVSNEDHEYMPTETERPSIGLTYTKGPEKVAKDIERRLLQDAEEYERELRNNRIQEEKRRKRNVRHQELIEEELGVAWRNTGGSGSPRFSISDVLPDLDKGYGHVRQNHGGSYEIKLQGISVEMLLDILHAIRDNA